MPRTALLLGFLGVTTLLVGAAGFGGNLRPPGDRALLDAARAARAAPGDTVVIWGPQQFNGSSGQGQTYVEAFTATITPGRLYTLRLINGAPNGTQRASKVTIRLNGFEIVSQNEVTQQVASLNRAVALTASDTLRITVAGSGSPFINLSILSITDPTFSVYGPNQYAITSGTTRTYDETFTRPAAAGAPFRLFLYNGASNGTQRVTSASVTLNGTQVFSTSQITASVGSAYKEVTLNPSNTLRVIVNGPVGRFVTLHFTASDTTRPVLTITTPAPGAAVSTTSVTVAGTISDATATTVSVNGTAATVTNNTSYTASVPLPTEGSNLLTVSAIDATGRRTDSTRTVIRDTQTPVLAVSAPPDGSGTRDPAVTVTGTVTDATPVTVNVNGTPLPVTGGSFSGSIALAYGANVLTTTATDLAQNAATDVRTVYRDTLAPVLTVSSPAGGATVSGDSVLVSGTVADESPVTVTANGVTLPVTSGAFSRKVPLGFGSTVVLVTATDAVNNRTTVSRSVFREAIVPPDPSTVAPPLDAGQATTMIAGVSFLFSGPDPIQTGVAAGTIVPTEVAVIRGRVLDRSGDPVPGAAVSIVGHPEFGGTHSRADGRYDLAVNGGDPLTLNVVQPGFLPLQRSIEPQVQTFLGVDDVVVTPVDPTVTLVDFSEPTQVARGSVQTDASGSRQQILVFKQGTQASMTLADGSVQPLGAIHVRATEYTVGTTGPAAMAGTLPPNSGYTYAAEFSVDEARAAGAARVSFSQPVASYVDNFLGFAVGSDVPAGFYDPEDGRWIPFEDGRVIKILSVTGGRADLDVTGDGVADVGAALTALGIDDAEREAMADEYPVDKVFWRVQVTHFSLMDWNWPFGPIAGALAPFLKALFDLFDPTRNPFTNCGSIIGCETQSLGEEFPVTGTPFSLAYRSERQAGRAGTRTVSIPITGSSIPPGLLSVQLEVYVAGQSFHDTFAPSVNQVYEYTWDGRDAYGRLLQGAQPVRVRVGYVYPAVYQQPAQYAQSFAQFSGIATTIPSRQQIILWQELNTYVGGFDPAALGLGGWTLSAHHFYDPIRRVLHLGTGERRDAEGISGGITTVAGTPGQAGFSGDGGPATAAKFNLVGGVAVGPDGSLYISDYNNRRIRRVSPAGIITTIAGNGNACCSGDGGPATAAAIGNPVRIRVTADGSVLFGSGGDETTPNIFRVRKVAPNGIISTVAGTGNLGFSGDGGPATSAGMSFAREVLPTPDGGFYFADWSNNRVRRVDANGIIQTIAGTGTEGSAGDGGPARSAQLNHPEGLAFGPDGALYIMDGGSGNRVGQKKLRRVGLDGIIRTVWGTGAAGNGGDGGPGTLAQIATHAGSIDIGADGTVYLATVNGCKIRQLGTDGIVTTFAGTATCGFSGDGGPATNAQVSDVFDVAVGPDGSVYIADLSNHVIRKVNQAFPGFSGSEIAIASEYGTELYQFSPGGRHLRTRDARTGAVVLTFGYNAAGMLVTVTDGDNNVTTVQRDGSGRFTGILGAFGQQTGVTLGAADYLASVTDPGGNRVRLFHSSGGMLDSLADPRGYVHRYTYDNLGRLRRDEDPAGGSKTLAATDSDSSVSVTVTTELNRATNYLLQQLPTGATRRVVTDPAGLITTRVELSSGRDSTTLSDGTRIVVQEGPDPRWGVQAPVVSSMTTRLPSGLTATVTGGRRAVLANATDPLSLTALTDSTILNGRLFRTVYEQATRRFTTTSPVGRQSFTTVDTAGRVTGTRTAGLDSVIQGYDNRGRLSQFRKGGRVVSYAYDARGRLVRTIDPLGRRDSLIYDDADRPVRQLLPGGREIHFSYDSSGNLTAITPPGRSGHTFAHTPVDLTSGYTPPNVGLTTPATTYAYNLDRQLTRVTRPDSVEIAFGFEAASGRLGTVTFDRGQLSYSYHPTAGTLSGITAPGGVTLAYTYDGSLPKTVTWGGAVTGSMGLTYNNDFRVTAQTVNGANSLGFAYDADGLLTAAGALGIKRHAQHGLVERDSLGDLLTVRSYDLHGGLASLSASHLGSPLFQTGYVRDSLSRITELTETVQGNTTVLGFTYDSAGRLFEVRRNGTLEATYEYDLNGNRTRLTTPSGAITATTDAQDRLTSYGTPSYTYGSNGELKTQTVPGVGTTSYTYDALGNLTAVTMPDGTQLGYLIDGQNRRIGKTVNGTRVQGFLYQGQLTPVAELNGSNQVVSRFVYGTRANVPDYLIKGGVTYRIVADHLGSVRLVVNTATGAVAQRLDYDEYGRVTQNSAPGFQPFGYAGGLLDEHTGLLRFGARDYDPTTGRWTAKDPLGFDGGQENLYAYAGNDPINLIDPSGLDAIEVPSWVEWVPVVGPGINAINAFSEGNYVGGVFNTAIAISDAFVLGGAVRGIRAGAFLLEGASDWRVANNWYRETRGLQSFEHAHHWAVQRASALYKMAPGVFNQPWNYMAVERLTHLGGLHGLFGGKQFGPLGRFWHGTPNWFKALLGSILGRIC